MSCGGCGLGRYGLGPNSGSVYTSGAANGIPYGAPFEISAGLYPAATGAALATSNYYRPGGYGYVFGYGSGYGTTHDGFRKNCCFPYYLPGSACAQEIPGYPAVGYGGWW